MVSQELFDLLEKNLDKVLRFEYQKGKFVNPNFHITEVKNTQINSVDCGGRKDSWNETILQLWNPSLESERYPMKGKKALQILNVVDQMDPIDMNAELYFEYGNANLQVSNYRVENILVEDESITFQFEGLSTQCKPAVERSGSTGSACCESSDKTISASACCA